MNHSPAAIEANNPIGTLGGILFGLIAFGVAGTALAHDTWVLTHDQEDLAHALPAPELFTALGLENSAIALLALVGIGVWIGIGRTDIPNQLASRFGLPRIDGKLLAPWVPFALRLGLAAMFITAAYCLHPRLGHDVGESPSLFAPDLEFRHISAVWGWLVWGQIALAFVFLLGIWVRVASVLLIGLVLLAFWLFGVEMLAYAGVLIGTAYYLLVTGGGRLETLVDPIFLFDMFEGVPAGRPQWVLRVLTGLSFLYLGVFYKFLHPTFLLAGVDFYDLPLFGFPPEIFVFIVATVETAVGVLITVGVMVRPLSFVLVFAFAFFSISMGESLLGHSFLYGVVFALFANGSGHWSARD